MRYQHHWINGDVYPQGPSKAVCVGRNYAQHAKELNNPIPETPLLFIKPSTSFVALQPEFSIDF
jgi:2-keto-4-pentenoate hydratase/2-oxohepta-3-ene-1,7-dioic acid hydratase in catechol pathway